MPAKVNFRQCICHAPTADATADCEFAVIEPVTGRCEFYHFLKYDSGRIEKICARPSVVEGATFNINSHWNFKEGTE